MFFVFFFVCAQFFFFFFFLSLKMKFYGPLSELHARGPAGEGGIGDAWQCAQQKERERGRERLTLQGAGRLCRQETTNSAGQSSAGFF